MRFALVFDFGGVLMKTASQAPRWAWDDRLGLVRGTVEQVVHGSDAWRQAQTGHLSVDAYWASVGTRLGLSPQQLLALKQDFFSADQLDSTLIQFIRSRKALGQRIALLSNDSPALLDKLNALGIAGLFDPLAISAHIGVMKPDPAAYRYVIDALACKPSDTVFIDDVQANIDGARAIGMQAVLYGPEVSLQSLLQPFLR